MSGAQSRERERPTSLATRRLAAAVLALLAVRVWLCLQVPVETTDAWRNLGYARHAFQLDPPVYHSVAADYAPESWSVIWGDQGFIYGPVVLVFFWCFAHVGLGIFWVKLALTAVDLAVAAVFSREVSPWAGLLYLAAPIGLWFVSHEGEFESLQTLGIALAAVTVRRGRWRGAGLAFALAAQTKAFGVLLLPWIALEWWRTPDRAASAGRFVQGGLLGTLPFAFFYWQAPLLLLDPIRRGIEFTYNPFAWNAFDASRFLWNPTWLVAWNALFTYAALAVALAFTVRARRERDVLALGPFAAFWAVIKSLRWAQFWYPIAAPGFLLCAERRRRSWVLLLLALHALQGGRSATMLLGPAWGFRESAQHRQQMEACLFRCVPATRAAEPRRGGAP